VVEVVVEGPDVSITKGVAVGAQDGRERAELQPCTAGHINTHALHDHEHHHHLYDPSLHQSQSFSCRKGQSEGREGGRARSGAWGDSQRSSISEAVLLFGFSSPG
jgi:hypothetical protein